MSHNRAEIFVEVGSILRRVSNTSTKQRCRELADILVEFANEKHFEHHIEHKLEQLKEALMGRIADDLKFYREGRDKAVVDLSTAQMALTTAQTDLATANTKIAELTPQVPDAADNAALDAADAERNPPAVSPVPEPAPAP